MFCKTCGLGINENIMYCPGCGNKLDRSSLSLNPLPGYVVHSNNENTTDTVTEPEVIVIDNPEVNNSDGTEPTTSIQFNGLSEGDRNTEDKEQSFQQIKSNLNSDIDKVSNNRSSIPDTSNSPNDLGLRTTIRKTKRNTYKIMAGLLIMVVIVGIIIYIKVHLNESNTNDNSTKSTDYFADVASATDSASNDIILEEDNFIISKSITIADKEYDSKSLQHFTDKNTGVNVTVYKIEISPTDMQMYCDEQESAYQLQSDEILDVVYIDDIYRYHFAQGYYQYGVLYQDSLVIYEISDNIDIEQCDDMAIAYFKTEGVIK